MPTIASQIRVGVVALGRSFSLVRQKDAAAYYTQDRKWV